MASQPLRRAPSAAHPRAPLGLGPPGPRYQARRDVPTGRHVAARPRRRRQRDGLDRNVLARPEQLTGAPGARQEPRKVHGAASVVRPARASATVTTGERRTGREARGQRETGERHAPTGHMSHMRGGRPHAPPLEGATGRRQDRRRDRGTDRGRHPVDPQPHVGVTARLRDRALRDRVPRERAVAALRALRGLDRENQ